MCDKTLQTRCFVRRDTCDKTLQTGSFVRGDMWEKTNLDLFDFPKINWKILCSKIVAVVSNIFHNVRSVINKHLTHCQLSPLQNSNVFWDVTP